MIVPPLPDLTDAILAKTDVPVVQGMKQHTWLPWSPHLRAAACRVCGLHITSEVVIALPVMSSFPPCVPPKG